MKRKNREKKDLRHLEFENTNHGKCFGKSTSKINKYKEKVRNDKRERPQRIQGVKYYYSTDSAQIAS